MKKGDLYWANLGEPIGNELGYRRPVIIVQSDLFNGSNIPTALIVPLTTNMSLSKAPGNIKFGAKEIGLKRDSVANVSQIISINRHRLDEYIGTLDPSIMFMVDNGIKLVFDV
jgi:mRNA interferase MazF